MKDMGQDMCWDLEGQEEEECTPPHWLSLV